MQLIVNGAEIPEVTARNVAELLRELGYVAQAGETPAHLAVAVNRELVRRADHAMRALKAGDEVEVLAPMAGG